MFRTLARLATRIRSTRSAGAVQALYDQGATAFGARRYVEAARCADQAVTIDPTSAASHFLLGCARLELGACEAAEAAFEACLRQKPEYPMVLHATMCHALSRARAGLAAGRTPQVVRTEPVAGQRISIIICSVDPQRFEKARANYRALLGSVSHEIIGIHDASSLCEGYNRGAARASGEILVFSHDDIEIVTADFAARLLGHLSRHDLVGVAGTTRLIGGSWTYAGWPHLCGQVGSRVMKPGSLTVTVYGLQGHAAANVQALDGVFLAARREVVERIRFDEETFDGWHLYDLDFSFSAHLAGFRIAVCQDICLIHDSSGTYRADWQRYVERFEDKHRGRLQKGQWYAQRRCSVEVASPEEWMLMAEEMISPAPRAATQ
jgi:tetratricopeptide (TPR) repeat protein